MGAVAAVTLLAALGVDLAATAKVPSPSPAPQRNLLYVVFDDLRPDMACRRTDNTR